jgi:transaldolase
VNVTLLFSVDRYRQTLDAYLDGLEAALAAGRSLEAVSSVASFFLSRIDTRIDRELDHVIAAGGPRATAAGTLRGEAAIASARVAYGFLEESLRSERFARLSTQGARPQRLLWASTGTKDPAYSDIKYVEPLIGPHTVNTMPLATLEAYHAHGDPSPRITEDRQRAASVLRRLGDVGIDLPSLTEQLLVDGIEQFARPYDALLAALDTARAAATAPRDGAE